MGIAHGSGPFWVADNGVGLSTLYNGMGGIHTLGRNRAWSCQQPGLRHGHCLQQQQAAANFKGDFFVFANEDAPFSGWKRRHCCTTFALPAIPPTFTRASP